MHRLGFHTADLSTSQQKLGQHANAAVRRLKALREEDVQLVKKHKAAEKSAVQQTLTLALPLSNGCQLCDSDALSHSQSCWQSTDTESKIIAGNDKP